MNRPITADRVFRWITVLSVISFAGVILYLYSNLVAYAAIAMILSYLLEPLVNKMQRVGMPRVAGITITLAILILLLAWISTTFLPILAHQTSLLAAQLTMENIQQITSRIERSIVETVTILPEGFLQENVTRISEGLLDTGRIPQLMSGLIGLFTNLFYAALVIPFATFFFLKDGHTIRRDLLRLVPNRYFETTLTLIDKVERQLGRYFRSVVVQCSLVGLFAWLFLSMAGLANATSVGITIGVANTIPYFGPLLGYILSIIISIIETGDFSLILPCMLAVLAVQLMDNVLFQPLIFSRSANMHPVAILFIIIIGAQTAGVVGMLVAIPIATVIKITITQILWSFRNYQVYRIETPPPLPPADTNRTG